MMIKYDPNVNLVAGLFDAQTDKIRKLKAENERMRTAIKRLLAWCENEAGNGCNLSDEQVADELESVELARAVLQPKKGEK